MSLFLEKVTKILETEAFAITRASKSLEPDAVERAIEMLRTCPSKVVVLGVGKSAIIANKIAETMTSTGTPAVFLHASDALHGSLGIIGAGDVVIALSNSGETEELVALLPAIAARGAHLIAIVGNVASTLARAADVVLDASVDKEACPLNLAPTTSTTVALALGDALAMALMESKNLSAEDFAVNHPAGRLGKRLTLRVGDLMQPSPNVAPDAGWLDVVKALSKHALGAVNVVIDGKLAGIVTDGDLRRSIERTDPSALSSLSARQMMTSSPLSTSASALAYDALRMMEDRPSQISVLPVIDADGSAVGLLRLHDIVRSGL